MNCQRFENVVSDLARGQMMAAEQRADALAHSETCDGCAARLRDEEMLTRGLQSLAGEMETVSAPANVEVALLEAFRAQRVVTPLTKKRSNAGYWLAAVAAMLLIVMSVVALRWRNPNDVPQQAFKESQAPKQVETPVKPDNQLAKDTVEEERQVETPKRQIIRKPARRQVPVRRPENTVANHVGNEIATDFIPLGYMSPASLQDGGQIVRVELPRSALGRFGLPVNMERYNEKVKADVLFGVDGMAHAIRFIQ
ncbi:MAG TPA: hypothetical protein VFR78_19315 [Pyrinomonadaceae bacterium]|nr:hypothetical protein [Pyrinomonadaceae bacterium]